MAQDTPNKPSADEERTICFCYSVSYQTIVEAIHKGAHTIDEVRADTCANTGCGGCEFDVRDILEAELPKLKKPAQEST